MAQLKNVVDPFGEVNVYPAAGGKHPRRRHHPHGAAPRGRPDRHRPGRLRLDARALRRRGRRPRPLAASSAARRSRPTRSPPSPRSSAAYLARNLDADGGTTCIYWAVGPGGSQVEVVGDLTADQAERHTFGPPQDFGTGTQLLPAVRYFVERFKDAPWGFYVFITDGELHDLDEVMAYSKRLAQDIAAGRRNPVKFVLIGVGPDVNEHQMEELDDLDTGTDVDLWDHKLAAEMRVLEEIFAEVVDKNARVADNGRILDPQGRVVKDYADVGLPAYLEFEVPAGADVLHPGGQRHARPPAAGGRRPAAGRRRLRSPPSRRPPRRRPRRRRRTSDRRAAGRGRPEPREWNDLPLEFGKDAERRPASTSTWSRARIDRCADRTSVDESA